MIALGEKDTQIGRQKEKDDYKEVETHEIDFVFKKKIMIFAKTNKNIFR